MATTLAIKVKTSPEFALVAACSRWPPSEQRNRAIRNAAKADIDWALVLKAARRQRVDGLVQNGLSAACVEIPPPVQQVLNRRAAAIARNNALLAGESVRLQKLLDEQQIPNLVLKGATLSVLAYDNPFVKSAWDVDLLIGPEDVLAAIAVLEENGYVRLKPSPKFTAAQFRKYVALARECIFFREDVKCPVEVKWRLVDNGQLLKGVSVRSDHQRVPVGGDFLRTLNKTDLFSYLCVHGAQHSWSRLKWIADLAALLEREPEAEIARLYRAAEQKGAGDSAAQALMLCEILLGTQLPPALSAPLHQSRKTRWLVLLAANVMGAASGGAARPQRFAAVMTAVSHFLLGRGRSFLAEELKLQWRSVHDRVHVPLPGRLGFLYHVIRLPLFVWRRIFGVAD